MIPVSDAVTIVGRIGHASVSLCAIALRLTPIEAEMIRLGCEATVLGVVMRCGSTVRSLSPIAVRARRRAR